MTTGVSATVMATSRRRPCRGGTDGWAICQEVAAGPRPSRRRAHARNCPLRR